MAITHTKDLKKVTGGHRRRHRKKKKADLGRPFLPATVGEEARKKLRVRGGNQKVRTLRTESANVSDGKKVARAKIKQVVENPSNPFFVRRNIITKGAVVETDRGYARVTSRPGQDGQVNAVLLPDYQPEKKKGKSKKAKKKAGAKTKTDAKSK
jgi:small subunit ribosomal protein S8e